MYVLGPDVLWQLKIDIQGSRHASPGCAKPAHSPTGVLAWQPVFTGICLVEHHQCPADRHWLYGIKSAATAMIMLAWMLHLLGMSSRLPDICQPLPYPLSPERAFVKTFEACITCSNRRPSCIWFHAALATRAHSTERVLATTLTWHPHTDMVPFLSLVMCVPALSP